MMSPTLLALFAYGWWGFVPLYWKLLPVFAAEELILYRILLSCVFLLPFCLSLRRRRQLASLLADRRLAGGLLLSGALIGFNWYLFVWAVSAGRVVEASLGYFINPLMNVVLGTLLLGETLNRAQKGACLLAAGGAALLTAGTGLFPWVAFLLALSFALYGLVRKLLRVPTIPGTFLETLVLTGPAVLGLLWLYGPGPEGGAAQATSFHWIVLAFCGLVTTVPLLAFAEAAKGLRLVSLGFFQFLSPSIQFLLGIFLFREPFGLLQWLSFLLIWAGLALFLLDLTRRSWR
jgi:chloramphenicol-sensitive protein RarD